jgi:hypothetical protein
MTCAPGHLANSAGTSVTSWAAVKPRITTFGGTVESKSSDLGSLNVEQLTIGLKLYRVLKESPQQTRDLELQNQGILHSLVNGGNPPEGSN